MLGGLNPSMYCWSVIIEVARCISCKSWRCKIRSVFLFIRKLPSWDMKMTCEVCHMGNRNNPEEEPPWVRWTPWQFWLRVIWCKLAGEPISACISGSCHSQLSHGYYDEKSFLWHFVWQLLPVVMRCCLPDFAWIGFLSHEPYKTAFQVDEILILNPSR